MRTTFGSVIFFRRPVWSALILVLSLLHVPAHADLWAYIDPFGVAHVANSPKNERYQLVFQGSDATRFDHWHEVVRLASKPSDDQLPAALSLPRRFTRLNALAGYQAVQQILQAAAQAYQVDYALLRAVVTVESAFQPNIVSSKGAIGLMQLMPDTARRYGVVADQSQGKDASGHSLPAQSVQSKLTDPRTNIDAGTRYLADLLRQFKGQLPLALAAYNAGEGAVQRAGNQVPSYRQTQDYVKTVLALYELFRSTPATPPQPAASLAQADDPSMRSLVLGSNRP